MGLSDGERISMIRSAVLQYTRVTDRQTDGQTDGIGVAYTRYSYMLSRVKTDSVSHIKAQIPLRRLSRDISRWFEKSP